MKDKKEPPAAAFFIVSFVKKRAERMSFLCGIEVLKVKVEIDLDTQ